MGALLELPPHATIRAGAKVATVYIGFVQSTTVKASPGEQAKTRSFVR